MKLTLHELSILTDLIVEKNKKWKHDKKELIKGSTKYNSMKFAHDSTVELLSKIVKESIKNDKNIEFEKVINLIQDLSCHHIESIANIDGSEIITEEWVDNRHYYNGNKNI